MSRARTTDELDGVELHVEGHGSQTIVMVQGWPDTWQLWDAQVAALRDRYRCIRFSLPGFEPGQPRRARTLDELCAFLERVVRRHCPAGKAILLLHDWGCFIGYEFATRHPELVERIIGVDIGDPHSLGRAASVRTKLMILSYQLWLASAWKIGGRLGDAMTRRMARAARCPTPPERIASRMNYPYWMLWFGGAESWRRQVHRFEPACPFLYLYGRRKPFLLHAPEWAENMRARPGNRVVDFDTGHWVMLQEPARFNDVLLEWLDGGAAATG